VVSWGGPELWEAVNKRRVELGVGSLSKKDELCTVASIRLNQLLALGTLDGHAGFEPTLSRPDLAYIKEKYNVAEFLIVGYLTPAESVTAGSLPEENMSGAVSIRRKLSLSRSQRTRQFNLREENIA